MLKALFFLEIFKLSCRLFGYVEKRLDKKAKVNSKSMTSQTGEQINKVHMLSNISRRKGNQTMKFGQLIDYCMRNIFLEKSYTKYG